MNTTATTALKAILLTKQTKSTYSQIQTITGHKTDKTPLTQIEVQNPTDGNTRTMITTKQEMEEAIMERNQRHSRQYLQMPFVSIPELYNAVNPNNPNNKIEQILNGTFTNNYMKNYLIEQEWIKALQTQISSSINETIEMEDFIAFFKKRKDLTASSSSGRHIGHYKVIADMAKRGRMEPADIIMSLINISIRTSRPLK